MTLDEAIQHCRDKENCSQCGQEHKRLREWLEELKDLRSKYNLPTPHGRLIDADRLIVAIKYSVYANAFFRTPTLTMSQIEQLIEHQPTVIEKEMN